MITSLARCHCRHCGSTIFHVFLDVRNQKIKVGEEITARPTDSVAGIECAACGEQYAAVQMGRWAVALPSLMGG